MQKQQTQAEQKEKLNIHTGVDIDNSKNYPLLTRTPIEWTPFEIVGNEELGYKLTWGRFNLTESMETEEEVRNWQLNNRWDITMKLTHIYVVNYFALKEQSKKEKSKTESMYDDHMPNHDLKEQSEKEQ